MAKTITSHPHIALSVQCEVNQSTAVLNGPVRISGANIFLGEYLLMVNIFQEWIFFRAQYLSFPNDAKL